MQNQNRVLAYTKATVIKKEELTNITGGDGKINMTSRQTIRATNGAAPGIDVAYDVGVDW